MTSATFGRPEQGFVRGGTRIMVYLVPVFDGRLVLFDVAAGTIRGRFLPFDLLPWAGNPYVTASELADQWCEGAMADLRLVDVMSFEAEGDGWELALIFRADLTSLPPGDDVRRPVHFAAGHFDAVGSFDPVDLERWVLAAADAVPAQTAAPAPTGLVF